MVEKLLIRCAGEVGPRGEGPVFGGDAPDAAVSFVAVWVAEAGLVMADDRIVPIADIKRAIGAKFDVDRPETTGGGFDEGGAVFEDEAGIVIADLEGPNRVIDVTAQDEQSLPGIGKMGSADDIPAAGFSAVSILPDERRGSGAMIQDQAGDRVDGGTIVAGQDDGFAPVRENEAPGVLRFVFGAEETFEFQPMRPEAPDTGLVQARDSPGRFNPRMGMQTLGHPEFTRGTPPE